MFSLLLTLHVAQFFPSSILFLFPDTLSVFSIPILHPPRSSFLYLSLSPDGFRLLSWWGWWPVWRLGCLVSRVIRADVARRGRSELSASASPRVTFHGQLVSEQRHARRLSASLIVKINGNQSPHSTLHSLPCSFHISASTSLFPPPVFLCCLSISLSFPLMCFCSSLANGCCLAICYLTVQLSLYCTLFATSVVLKSYNDIKAHRNPMLVYLICTLFDFFFSFSTADCARFFLCFPLKNFSSTLLSICSFSIVYLTTNVPTPNISKSWSLCSHDAVACLCYVILSIIDQCHFKIFKTQILMFFFNCENEINSKCIHSSSS